MKSSIRQSGSEEFWRLLSAYEEATIAEARALSLPDFEKLDTIQDFKAATLRKLVSMGRGLGLDRRNPDLRSRLEAIERAEKMNMESLSAMMESARREGEALSGEVRRLHSVRDTYAAGKEGEGFFAEG